MPFKPAQNGMQAMMAMQAGIGGENLDSPMRPRAGTDNFGSLSKFASEKKSFYAGRNSETNESGSETTEYLLETNYNNTGH